MILAMKFDKREIQILKNLQEGEVYSNYNLRFERQESSILITKEETFLGRIFSESLTADVFFYLD